MSNISCFATVMNECQCFLQDDTSVEEKEADGSLPRAVAELNEA